MGKLNGGIVITKLQMNGNDSLETNLGKYMADKIKLRALIDTDSKLYVVDQDGREFDFIPEYQATIGKDNCVQIKVDIEYPYWPNMKPHVEITFRVPLEVKSEALEAEFAEFWKHKHG